MSGRQEHAPALTDPVEKRTPESAAVHFVRSYGSLLDLVGQSARAGRLERAGRGAGRKTVGRRRMGKGLAGDSRVLRTEAERVWVQIVRESRSLGASVAPDAIGKRTQADQRRRARGGRV